MSLVTLEVIGREEDTRKAFRCIVKINKKTFKEDYNIPATYENIRRQIISDFLANAMIISNINVLATSK